MQEIWAALTAFLILFLAANAPGYYLGAILFLARRRRMPEFSSSRDHVTVLIPARNEGRGALRAVESLLNQDYEGMLEIAVLVRDESDTCVPFLQAAFAFERCASSLELQWSSNRRISIYFTGCDAKHAKINWTLPRIESPFTAVLDADHQAHPDWIRTSVAILKEKNGRIVQARREPISAHGLFGLWDSLHQHIGCEVFNEAFSRMGLTVFFTGSTAVFDSELLKNHPLADCLTEDTNLSYERILSGEKILYNPYSGSSEEVSPDLYSFLARRRRWAHGHTEAFFRHLSSFWKAPLGMAARIQFVVHGLHYLVALAVFGAHALLGLYIAHRLDPPALAAASAAGFILAVSVVRSQHVRKGKAGALAISALFFWFTPAAVFLIALVQGLSGNLSALHVPIHPALQAAGLICLAAPLVMLLAGLGGFKQLGPGITAAVLLTYPAGLYLFIAGTLVGLVDLLTGHRIWHVIGRGASPSLQGRDRRGIRDSWRTRNLFRKISTLASNGKTIMKPVQWFLALAVLVLLSAGVYFAGSGSIPVADRSCTVLEHDRDPWIVQPQKNPGYCGNGPSTPGRRTGSFSIARKDELSSIDPAYWDRLSTTFFCNEAVFSPPNVQITERGMELLLRAEPKEGKRYTAGSIATKDTPEARHLYGRFEVELKPVRASGVITAFFLYRFDPWQEIDMEFLGRDTTKVLINVFYNPGEEGDLYNYGYRGTPVLVDLGFDAADAVHRYAIEWDPGEIRWFVDDVLIHARPAGKPTPIPHLPMRFHINTWPVCSEELAGRLDTARLPASTEVRSVSVFKHSPPILERFFKPARSDQWRDAAKWMQPGR